MPLHGQNEFIYSSFSTSEHLNPFVDVYETAAELPPEMAFKAIKNEDMELRKVKSSAGFSTQFFWLHFFIYNSDSIEAPLYTILENPHIDSAVLFEVINSDSLVARGKAGDRMPFGNRQLVNRNIVFYVDFQPHEKKEFLLFIDKRNASVSFPLKVRDKNRFQAKNQFSGIMLGIVFGTLLFIALFSLIIGRILWQKIFLYYGLYVLFLVAYLFTDSGLSFQFIYPDSVHLNNYSRVILYKLFSFFLISFSVKYLNINLHKPHVAKAMYLVYIAETTIQVLIIFLFGHMPFYVLYILNVSYVSFFLMSYLTGYFLVTTYKRQEFYNLSYGFSVGIVLVAMFVSILIEYGFIQEYMLPFSPIVGGAFIEVSALSIFLIFRIKDIYTHRMELMQELNEQKKKLMQAYVKGGDQERNFISQELHDNVGARLVVLKNLFLKRNRNKEASEINEIINDVRQLSHKLSPPVLPLLGFKESLIRLAEEYNQAHDVLFKLEMFSAPEPDRETGLQLYRVFQEAFKNIIIHSGATRVDIQVFGYPEQLVVTIDDNGQGIPPEAGNEEPGVGIYNMKSRIESLSGTFEMSSYPGKGVNILITVPLN
jgi:signal transduction histidine kinase